MGTGTEGLGTEGLGTEGLGTVIRISLLGVSLWRLVKQTSSSVASKTCTGPAAAQT
jgi:hypothetical protein